MTQFFFGANVLASLMIALFFLRFWFRTHDRLFAIFAAAFVLLAINWLMQAFPGGSEGSAQVYLIRLIAYVLIIVAIIDKNRRPRPAGEYSEKA